MTSALSQTWADGEAGGTPLSAARLTAIVAAINAGISAADTAQATANTAQSAVDAAQDAADTAQATASGAQSTADGKQDQIPTYATLTAAQAAVASGDLVDGRLCVITDPLS